MTLLIKGIDRLSQLLIDADKEWAERGITNIKQVAAYMSRGDIVVRDTSLLVRLQAGPEGYVLTSAGAGQIPAWAPAGGALKYYFPVRIYSGHSESIVTVDRSIPKAAHATTSHVENYVDAPGDLIKRTGADVASSHGETVVAGPDQSIAITPTAPRSGLSILCDGFVEETAAAVQTDKTTEARSAAANDLNLNPMTPAAGDKVYVGSEYKFWQIQMELGITGVGNWLNHWYYWDGGAWAAAVDEVDGSNEWQHGTGLKMISHTPQAGWARCNILGMDLYWLMSNTDNFVSQITRPQGSQVWVAIA